MTIVPLVYVALGVLYWLVGLVLAVRVVRAVPVLARSTAPPPSQWPRVSLIIPARDEAEQIEAAVRSRLAEGYPNLELILVDDRSSDGTAEIVDRLAAADQRVRATHIDHLPDGWLGKVYAMHVGSQLATGDWLLLSDADVHLAPGTLQRVIAFVTQRRLDHLAIVPELWPAGFVIDAVLATFIRVFSITARMWAVADQRSRASVGIGAFNLVRRSALDRAGGFHRLRLEIVDDAALGQIVKHSGARSAVANGRGLVALHWYRSLADMATGVEKSVYAVLGRFSALRLAVVCLGFILLELAPLVGLLFPPSPALVALASTGLLAAIVTQIIPSVWTRRPLLPAILYPLGSLLLVAVALRAGVLAVHRGGLLWRGRLYPTELLRQGMQFRFP